MRWVCIVFAIDLDVLTYSRFFEATATPTLALSRFSVRFFSVMEFPAAESVHPLRLLELSMHKKFRGRESFVYYLYIKKGIRQIAQHRRPLRRQYDLLMMLVLRVRNCFSV
jgi:hypothetical protein